METIHREGIIVARQYEILTHTGTEKKGQGGNALAGSYMSAQVDLSLSFLLSLLLLKL